MSILSLKRKVLASSMESVASTYSAQAFKPELTAFEVASMESANQTEFLFIDSLRSRLTNTVKSLETFELKLNEMAGKSSDPAARTDNLPAEDIEANRAAQVSENDKGFAQQGIDGGMAPAKSDITTEPKMADLSDDAAITKIANKTESLLKSTEGLESLWTLHGYSLEADTETGEGLKAKASGMAKNVGAIIKKIWDFIRSLAAKVGEAIKNAWVAAKEYLGRAKDFAMRALNSRGEKVRERMTAFVKTIKDKLTRGETQSPEIAPLLKAAEGGKASAIKAVIGAAMAAPGNAVDKFENWMLNRALKKTVFEDEETGETYTLDGAKANGTGVVTTESLYSTMASMEASGINGAKMAANAYGASIGGVAGHSAAAAGKTVEAVNALAKGKIAKAGASAVSAVSHAGMAALNWALAQLTGPIYAFFFIATVAELAVLGVVNTGPKLKKAIVNKSVPEAGAALYSAVGNFVDGIEPLVAMMGEAANSTFNDPSSSPGSVLSKAFEDIGRRVGVIAAKNFMSSTESNGGGQEFSLQGFDGEVITVTMSGSDDDLGFSYTSSSNIADVDYRDIQYVDVSATKSSTWKDSLKKLVGMFDPMQKMLQKAIDAVKNLSNATAKAEKAATQAGEEGESMARKAAKGYNSAIEMLQKVVVQPLKKLTTTAPAAASTLGNMMFQRAVVGAA